MNLYSRLERVSPLPLYIHRVHLIPSVNYLRVIPAIVNVPDSITVIS